MTDDKAVIAKLATIEANMDNLTKQMDHVVKLLDRMVRVEEIQANMKKDCDLLWNKTRNIDKDIDTINVEIGRWATGRKIFAWLAGVVIALAGVLHFGGGR